MAARLPAGSRCWRWRVCSEISVVVLYVAKLTVPSPVLRCVHVFRYSEQLSDAASKSAAAAYSATLGASTADEEIRAQEAAAAERRAKEEAAAAQKLRPPSSSIPRMRVFIAPQVILVPVATDSPDHVELRMAQIVVGNVLERDLVAEAQVRAFVSARDHHQ